MAEKTDRKSAKVLDKEREADLKKTQKREKVQKEKRKIKRTTIQTMPYECFVSNYVMLLKSNIRVDTDHKSVF